MLIKSLLQCVTKLSQLTSESTNSFLVDFMYVNKRSYYNYSYCTH